MKNIIYVPLDERPCNYKFMPMLARGTDYNVLVPPPELLGRKKTPADVDALWSWVFENAVSAEGAILSIDMLVYGGIIPSRLHKLSAAEGKAVLGKLRKLKALNVSLKIYAFNLIMRCPSYSSSDEEPDYYQDFGTEIFKSGFLGHKNELNETTKDEETEYALIANRLPAQILQDYTSRRKINLEINKLSVDLLTEGTIDFLVIPQDDSAPYGFTAIDQSKLRNYIGEKNAGLKAYMYPGADEVGMTLFARMVNEAADCRPSVYLRFSSIRAPFVVPLYEDRLLYESIKYHVLCAGGLICDSLADADMVLMVNAPAEKMLEANQQQTKGSNYTVGRNLIEFVEYMDFVINTKKLTCAVADVAFANGSDLELLNYIKQKNLLYKLCSYAGWNTSSNTLGTAITQAFICRLYGATQSHYDFLGLRYVEDAAYCAQVRQLVTERYLPGMQLNYFKTDGPRGKAAEIVKQELQKFSDSYLGDARHNIVINDVYMPWSRMFEVGLDVEVKG